MEVSIILKATRGHILYIKNTSSTHKKMEDKGRNRGIKSQWIRELIGWEDIHRYTNQ